jgi:hypothetical protein
MSQSAAPRIRRGKRGLEAMNLRLEGLRYSQIAERMHASEQYCWRLVQGELQWLSRQRAEAAEQVAQLELARLDEMFHGIWPKAKQGDLAAVDRVLQLMQRRAKILGLDAETNAPQAAATQVTLNISEMIVAKEAAPGHEQPAAEPAALASQDAPGPAGLHPQ